MRQVQLHGLLLQDHVTADAGQVAPSLGCTSLHIAIQTTLMFDNMIAQVAAEQYSGHSRHKIDTFAACRMYDVLLFPMTSDVYQQNSTFDSGQVPGDMEALAPFFDLCMQTRLVSCLQGSSAL